MVLWLFIKTVPACSGLKHFSDVCGLLENFRKHKGEIDMETTKKKRERVSQRERVRERENMAAYRNKIEGIEC